MIHHAFKVSETHFFLMIHLDNVEIGHDKLYMLIIQLIWFTGRTKEWKILYIKNMINTNGSPIWKF